MTPGERHREFADAFGARVAGTEDWDAPTPVPGWVARDVVRHLVTWLPGLLGSRGWPSLPPPSVSVDDDPAAAWKEHAAAVQELLDGPGGEFVIDDPFLGGGPLAGLVDRIYTTDVFLHTWDLARATGQDDTLDAETCAALLAGMPEMEGPMRASGQFGPRVPVPDDAPVQDRLIGFIGRDPGWRPPA
jgi:uncharacterized protein (TIGR03086 family)